MSLIQQGYQLHHSNTPDFLKLTNQSSNQLLVGGGLHYILNTYCKRGYFSWGKISRKCWQDISRRGNFHDITPVSFLQAYGFNFRMGVNFAKKTKA